MNKTTSQRVSRKEQRRQQVEQQKRRRNRIIGGVVAAVVVVVVGVLAVNLIRANIEGVIDFGPQEQDHDEGVVIEVESLPPVGGVHSPQWQNCGIYTEPVEAKYAIHSMEHGAVWIAYNPELPAGDVAQLQELVRGQTYMLLSPYPGLASNIVLTAWGVQLEVESVDDERIERFIGTYRLGSQTPEFGAPCTEGVGAPQG
ncbi:MAG: DUF3105 domain-containing protein [Chloroflexi bacterium]|nr:DUF3105 domain-containing protein [Chloroflexota bacterium]MCI0580308.1 DUF3105 domain-containing protein [Chloroflexota bacterium]MCI0648073.1 DUF3105 domain-containing protein [Chloroflexota bacterium]MCI0730904.1 DUF3105 domain-containing protein [Chloroflexota bacterium]